VGPGAHRRRRAAFTDQETAGTVGTAQPVQLNRKFGVRALFWEIVLAKDFDLQAPAQSLAPSQTGRKSWQQDIDPKSALTPNF
jgi:hypothetical protein